MNELQDERTEIRRVCDAIATEALMPLIHASDAGLPLTPFLISQVSDVVSKLVEQVHYGFHPDLVDPPVDVMPTGGCRAYCE